MSAPVILKYSVPGDDFTRAGEASSAVKKALKKLGVAPDVIRKVAAVGPCVIVGRCADYVLRNQEGVLNLFIHAPLDERIFRAKEEYKVEAADVRAYVLKQDKRRAAFYEHFSDRVWGKAENYHLAINSTIGLDTTVDLILALAEERGLHK